MAGLGHVRFRVCVVTLLGARLCECLGAMGFLSMKGWNWSVFRKRPGLSGPLELLDQSCRFLCPKALITVRGPSLPQEPAGAPGGGPDVANGRGCCQPGFREGVSVSLMPDSYLWPFPQLRLGEAFKANCFLSEAVIAL